MPVRAIANSNEFAMRLQDTTFERWKVKYGEFRGALKEAHPEFLQSLKAGGRMRTIKPKPSIPRKVACEYHRADKAKARGKSRRK